MSDEARTDHEHVYPKKSDQYCKKSDQYCAICGPYRHADYIKAVGR
jgi:hypothetical protein